MIEHNQSGKVALIALGANLPLPEKTPLETLQAAISSLQGRGLVIRAVSRFYETPGFPQGAGPDYVNAALCAHWGGRAQDLLALLHTVEAEFARTRETRWGMRTLDLDLIGLGDAVLPDRATWAQWRDLPAEAQRQVAPDRLILPHPRLEERGFVLVPLAEVAPDWCHPVTGASVAAMCAALPATARAEVKAL